MMAQRVDAAERLVEEEKRELSDGVVDGQGFRLTKRGIDTARASLSSPVHACPVMS